MHNHDAETAHIIIVAKGSVVILGQDPASGQVESSHQEAGAVLDSLAGFPHGIVCVTPGSRTIHIRKKLSPPAPPASAGAA